MGKCSQESSCLLSWLIHIVRHKEEPEAYSSEACGCTGSSGSGGVSRPSWGGEHGASHIAMAIAMQLPSLLVWRCSSQVWDPFVFPQIFTICTKMNIFIYLIRTSSPGKSPFLQVEGSRPLEGDDNTVCVGDYRMSLLRSEVRPLLRH